MSKPNHPIAVNHMAWMVMLRNGHMVPLERWADKKDGPQFTEPKSKKEARKRKKTIELSVRRIKRAGPFGSFR